MNNVQSRPGTTDRTWHMGEVENEQAMLVARGTGQANTFTTTAGSDIGLVNTNVS